MLGLKSSLLKKILTQITFECVNFSWTDKNIAPENLDKNVIFDVQNRIHSLCAKSRNS